MITREKEIEEQQQQIEALLALSTRLGANHVSKQEIIEALGLDCITFDFALPQNWCDGVYQDTGVYPVPFFIWAYDGDFTTFGRPCAISIAGNVLLAVINHLHDTSYPMTEISTSIY